MESVAPEWGITRVPFKAEASVGKRWNIYRKEVSYDYTPDDPSQWTTPNLEVIRALAAREEDSAVLADKSVLAGDVEIPGIDDSGVSLNDVDTDADWTEEDGATPWGFARTDDSSGKGTMTN